MGSSTGSKERPLEGWSLLTSLKKKVQAIRAEMDTVSETEQGRRYGYSTNNCIFPKLFGNVSAGLANVPLIKQSNEITTKNKIKNVVR